MDLPVFAALVLPPLSWIAVEGYRRMTTERRARERERELDVARTIQRRLLPSGPPDVAEAAVFGVNVAADAVGGDYYDWVNLGDDELAVVVGDVSGHGVPAALLMSHLRASFHAEAKAGRSPSEIVQAIHDSLARATESGRFATFFLAQVSRREPRLRYCNAGHNPPMLVRGDAFEALMPTGLPLAMMEDSAWGEAEREFRPGDTLVLHSDGVTEAPHKGEFYGDERWQALVMGLVKRSLEPEPMVQALLADVSAFAREELATDDVTIVVVRRTEGAAPGP
jgi:sigma-B regulation protein RsbU (phosphoserine phosphatase)